jgi:hypothetical protein
MKLAGRPPPQFICYTVVLPSATYGRSHQLQRSYTAILRVVCMAATCSQSSATQRVVQRLEERALAGIVQLEEHVLRLGVCGSKIELLAGRDFAARRAAFGHSHRYHVACSLLVARQTHRKHQVVWRASQ